MKWLAEKLGYIHKSELTEEFLSWELAKMIGNPNDYSIEKKQEEQFFQDLAKIDGVMEYLSATAAKDMQRYFAAPQGQQDVVKGAFARTVYLKSRLTKSKNNPQEIDGLRYGD